MLKRLPFAPLSLAIFPILALLAHNITEVFPRIALRSFAISLAATLIPLAITALITRNMQKAAITTTLASSLARINMVSTCWSYKGFLDQPENERND